MVEQRHNRDFQSNLIATSISRFFLESVSFDFKFGCGGLRWLYVSL